MKEFITARQAKLADAKSRRRLGISTLVLMENAGHAIADEVMKNIRGNEKVGIFCGKGNNGGDGFVAARHLIARGVKAEVFLAGGLKDTRDEARINLDILLKLKKNIRYVNGGNFKAIAGGLKKYAVIVDALLGVGLRGKVQGVYGELIGLINSSPAYILSVDIPSGLDATTGNILGCCVKADKTVTFMAKKSGMARNDGPLFCGKVVVAGIGFPFSHNL